MIIKIFIRNTCNIGQNIQDRCEQCVYVEQGESETDQCLPATHRHQQPPV